MGELYRERKIKAIGISNFYPDRLLDVIDHNEIVPAVNQVETHLFCQQQESQELMKENNVQIMYWGPFADGRNEMFNNEVLVSGAKKYNKSVAQVILRWLTQRDIVVIPKSVHKERITENYNINDFELNQEDMETISTLRYEGKCILFSQRP